MQAVSTEMGRTLEYAQVDVFAERALEGNQLAIFADGRGLTDAEMQAIARETNLSETTFILPREEAVELEQGVRVRIFTTEEELPFAGHPTLGTASWLYWHHPVLRGAEEIRLELSVGLIPVRFRVGEVGLGVFGTMRQNDPVFGPVHERGLVADALGLTLEDLDSDMPVQTVSTGTAFCIVPLRTVAAMERMRVQPGKERVCLAASGARWFYCVTRANAGSGADWRARMQFSGGDDPATGSAAGCAIAYMVRHGLAGSEQQVVISQGSEMKRTSRIYVQAVLDRNTVSGVRVGGRTIPVAAGRLILP